MKRISTSSSLQQASNNARCPTKPTGVRVKSLLSIVLCYAIAPLTAHADLPLSLENLLTDQHRYRMEFGLNYANSDRRNVSSNFDMIQTGTGDFVLIPVQIGEQRQNSDIFAVTAGLRYGFSKTTEIYTRLTGTASNTRTQQGTEGDSHASQQFNSLVAGANRQFSADDKTPALLGFAEISLAENIRMDGTEIIHGKTALIGLTAHRSIDPLVLSMTAGYRYSGKRTINHQTIDPGDLFFVNPSVGFAVNDQMTLTGGLQVKFRKKDKLNNHSVGIQTSSTDLQFGLAYSADYKTTLNITARTDISGDSGAQIGFNWLRKF